MNNFNDQAAKWADLTLRNVVKGRNKCNKCGGSGNIGYDNDGIWVDAITCDECHGNGDVPKDDWLDRLCGRPRIKGR